MRVRTWEVAEAIICSRVVERPAVAFRCPSRIGNVPCDALLIRENSAEERNIRVISKSVGNTEGETRFVVDLGFDTGARVADLARAPGGNRVEEEPVLFRGDHGSPKDIESREVRRHLKGFCQGVSPPGVKRSLEGRRGDVGTIVEV